MEKVMVIIGPTAVGKTALSFALAEHYGTDLISGDAYQIYRHMDIGTAKPTADELARYHHYLIDIAEPDEPYSAARFCDMAGKAIAEVNGKGKVPIVVGGTGLYVQSLLEGYDFGTARMTEAAKDAAQARIASLDEGGLKEYIRRNTDWEPPDWHELLANTHRLTRLVSAIENGEGKAFVRSGKAESLVYDAYVIGLRLPREILYARIEERVDAMLKDGWVEEVRRLLAMGVPEGAQAMKAIGYQELARYLKGQLSLEEAAVRIKTRTRRFAKRQLTWFKRMPYIHWYEKDQYEDEAALARAVIRDIDAHWRA
ncbi:tRNA (adenosine(37)-N6)-dimethylallyltransferase MiaA [uncultured Megasphaera sp.]|uniref:tRNA (adenosine(37)-N6)-dimethylallyltransferase MiaA n=1 Tax=uncultured Megasphaera sp. TaxID=165188 RepID=UPI0025E0521C|nr:tRNA (adenosine(37)-N6)-dimethylallyltransferase MiaA [uncultured Megasphaera sp.]